MDSQDVAQLDTEVKQFSSQDAAQTPLEIAEQDGGQKAQEDAAAEDRSKPLSEAEGSQTAPSCWQEPSDEGTIQEIGAVCGGSQPPPWSFHPPWPPAMGPPGVYQQGMSSPGMGSHSMSQQSMGPPAMGPPAMSPPGIGSQGMCPPGMGHTGMPPPGMAPPGMCPPGMCAPGMCPPGMGPHGMGPPGMGPCMPPPGFVRYSACQPPPMMYRLCYPHPSPGPVAPKRNRKRRREQRVEPEEGETPAVAAAAATATTTGSADASGRPYTPRASKITTQNPSTGASDMLVEALRRGPDAAMRIARSLFSKRMLTLYGWLYPKGARRDVKHSIDRLWERLPAPEKRFYIAQAEGAFGSRGGRPMINPQLAALAGLPGQGHAEAADAEPCDTPGSETEQAVSSLLQLVEDDAVRNATTTSEGWDGGDPDYDNNPLGLPRLLELARQSGLGNDEYFTSDRGSRDSDEYSPNLESLGEFPSGNGLLRDLTSDDYKQTMTEFPSEDCAVEESLVDGYHGEGYQGDVVREEEVEYRMEEIHGEVEHGEEYYLEEYQAEEYHGELIVPELGREETLFDEEFAVAHEVVLSADGDELE